MVISLKDLSVPNDNTFSIGSRVVVAVSVVGGRGSAKVIPVDCHRSTYHNDEREESYPCYCNTRKITLAEISNDAKIQAVASRGSKWRWRPSQHLLQKDLGE